MNIDDEEKSSQNFSRNRFEMNQFLPSNQHYWFDQLCFEKMEHILSSNHRFQTKLIVVQH